MNVCLVSLIHWTEGAALQDCVSVCGVCGLPESLSMTVDTLRAHLGRKVGECCISVTNEDIFTKFCV